MFSKKYLCLLIISFLLLDTTVSQSTGILRALLRILGLSNHSNSAELLVVLKMLLLKPKENSTLFVEPTDNSRLPQPIDEIIENAEEPQALDAFEPQFLPREEVFKIEGDIVMDMEQFLDMEKNVTMDAFEEELAKRLIQRRPQNSQTLKDIVDSLAETSFTQNRRNKRAARRDSSRYWPNGVMPIRIASQGFTPREKTRIANAMNRISEATCICFKIISSDQAVNEQIKHVQIVNGNGCRSFVGVSVKSRGSTPAQDLTLRKKCRNFRVITHELLHALGLFHEQSRPDRDQFVKIVHANIKPGKRRNFRKLGRRTADSRGVPYDYRSIMHYSNRAFSRNKQFTIVPVPEKNKQQFLNRIGRSTRMSEGDIEILKLMYECPANAGNPTCADYPYTFP